MVVCYILCFVFRVGFILFLEVIAGKEDVLKNNFPENRNALAPIEKKKIVVESGKLLLKIYFKIIGNTNCDFTFIPRFIAGSTAGKSSNFTCKILSNFVAS